MSEQQEQFEVWYAKESTMERSNPYFQTCMTKTEDGEYVSKYVRISWQAYEAGTKYIDQLLDNIDCEPMSDEKIKMYMKRFRKRKNDIECLYCQGTGIMIT